MAEWSGPWDNSDFTESEWRQLFASTVLPVGFSDLPVTPSLSDRNITIGSGRAVVQGHLYINDANVILTNSAPPAGQQRIDYLVLRLDPTEAILADRIVLALVQGTPSSGTPSAPALTQNENGTWEQPLVRYGPYGTGAMSGAPSTDLMTNVVPAMARKFSDPNEVIEGLPKVAGSMYLYNGGIDGQSGRLYAYDEDSGEYEWAEEPATGTFGSYSGWGTYGIPYTSRWSLSKDGLVTLQGIRRRTSGTIEIPRGSGDAVPLVLLPTSIRMPGSDYSSTFLCVASLRYVSSGGTSYHVPVRITHGNDGVLRASAALGSQQLFAHTNSWISLDGISYRV
jgi:hypothetical protein